MLGRNCLPNHSEGGEALQRLLREVMEVFKVGSGSLAQWAATSLQQRVENG